MLLTRALRHYLLALQFFSRVPVTGRLAAWVGFSPDMLRASAGHFPGVGWLVGAVAAGVMLLALWGLPPSPYTPLVAAALSTAASVLLTGAFHEDGLADVADGLGGSPDRDRALQIMKDSRIGAFGAIALVLALASKLALLALLGSLSGPLVACGLFLAHVLSRGFPLMLIRLLPYVGDAAGSKSKPLADQIGIAALACAGAWCALALGFTAYLQNCFSWFPTGLWLRASALALVAGAIAWLLMWHWFARRLQGFTGDCLGATQQLCELACYLGLALAWR
jgi:adenosylcobinamide-GDP ribazoletransferase